MRNLRQRIGRVGEIALKAENTILLFFMFMIVVIVFCGVIVRYTPITAKTIWIPELARLFLLWVSFWAAGSIERVGGHFKFDMFTGLFSGKSQLFLELFIKLVVLVSLGILIWWTIAYCETIRGVQTTILQWPIIIRASPLLVGSSLLFIYCLTSFVQIFRRLFK